MADSSAQVDVRGSAAARTGALQPSCPEGFDGFTGIFQDAGPVGPPPVLLLSAFGYEELCCRAFHTHLADALARRGIATLRFDFPGTADALDRDPEGLEDWRIAAETAADRLRALTGHDHITVLGQGLGAALAIHWADRLGPLESLVLLDPPTSGRAYLRGLKAWGAVIASASGLEPDPLDPDGLAVAGFGLPATRAAAIRALESGKAGALPSPSVLLLTKNGGGAALKPFVARQRAFGVTVTEAELSGFDALLTDPTSALMHDATVATITEWLGRAGLRAVARLPVDPPINVEVCDADFAERPIRFGPGGTLAGVICTPAAGPSRRAVVLVSAGRDHHIGWARSTVLQARALARAGISTLRFDLRGIGDSRAPDRPEGEILYSGRQIEDLRAAVDAVALRGHATVGLVGRCSGAWAAFTLAAEDERVEALVLINTGYFLWDATKNLADVIRFSQRSVGDLGATFLKRAGFRRLLAGDLDVRGAARFLVRQVNLRLVRRYASLLGGFTAESRRYRELHRLFGLLRNREVGVRLLYSGRDASLGELRSFMGPEFARLRRYENVTVREIAGADHNFTHTAARNEVRDEIVAFFGSARAPTPVSAPAVAPRPSFHHALEV